MSFTFLPRINWRKRHNDLLLVLSLTLFLIWNVPNTDASILIFLFSVELQKANLEATDSPPTSSTTTGNNANSSTLPLAQLLSKPGTLSALHSLQALGGLSDLLALNLAGTGNQVQTTGLHRPQSRGNFNNRRDHDERKIKNESKYNPY